MIFGEKTEEQKRVAELTREVKELRKELLASKLDKKQVEVQMKDLKDALELGGNLRQGYVDSQEHMAVAASGRMIRILSPQPTDSKIWRQIWTRSI